MLKLTATHLDMAQAEREGDCKPLAEVAHEYRMLLLAILAPWAPVIVAVAIWGVL